MRKRGNGEGSLFYDGAAKRWKYKTPGPERKTFSARTQREALQRGQAYLARSGRVSKQSARQPLRDYLATWLVSLDVRDKTRDGYDSLIRTHINPHAGSVMLGKLSAADVQNILDKMSEKGRAGATRYQVWSLLFTALERARKQDVIDRNVVERVDPPRPSRAEAEPLHDAEITALLKAIEKDRLRALWLLYLWTGLRRGEALALSRDDVRFEVGDDGAEYAVVTIRRSLQRVRGELVFVPPKTRKGSRTLQLSPELTEPLRTHMRVHLERKMKLGASWTETGLLFTTTLGTPLEPRNVLRRFQQLVGKKKLHSLRHTAISLQLREGVALKDAQHAAGHARASVTADTYAHRLTGTSGEVSKAMERAMRKLRG